MTPARGISLLLLEISQILLAGARLGAQVDFTPEEEYQPDVGPDADLDGLRLRLADLFGNVDTYSFVFDPYDPEQVDSQLSDDLTSIASDLENGLRHFRLGDTAEALWWWQFSYVSSWGNLAGAVLNALLSVVAHDRLDVEFTGETDQVAAAEEMLGEPAPTTGPRRLDVASAQRRVADGAVPRLRPAYRGPQPVGIVVQKYGGSSVADAAGIKRVARRIVDTRRAGHDVVVVVSAMGDTTDELLDLAEQVSPLPPPRELDMLLTAGERISMALLAMAIAELGHKAQSFTGSQAGVITDSAHGKAKIIDVTPGRIADAIDDGRDRDRRRLPGRLARTPRTSPPSAAAAPTPPRSRWRRRSAPRSARSTPTSTASSPPTRASSRPPASSTASPRGDARDGRARRQDPAPAVRRVRPPLRHPDPRPVLLHRSKEGTWIVARRPGGSRPPWKQAIIAGVAHDRSEAKITVVGVPDKVGEAARIFEALAEVEINIDMIVQNVSAAATGLTDISFTLPRDRRPDRDGGAGQAAGRGRLRPPAVRRRDRQGLPGRRRHALAPRHHREVLRAPWPTPASTSR